MNKQIFYIEMYNMQLRIDKMENDLDFCRRFDNLVHKMWMERDTEIM